jgi:anti-anti-sigma regulatory factor
VSNQGSKSADPTAESLGRWSQRGMPSQNGIYLDAHAPNHVASVARGAEASWTSSGGSACVGCVRPALEIWIDERTSPAIVRLAGVLDQTTEETFLRSMDELLVEGVLDLVMDAGRVEIGDVGGASALTRLQRRTRELGGSLTWEGIDANEPRHHVVTVPSDAHSRGEKDPRHTDRLLDPMVATASLLCDSGTRVHRAYADEESAGPPQGGRPPVRLVPSSGQFAPPESSNVGAISQLHWIADFLDLADKALSVVACVQGLDYPPQMHREAQHDLRAWARWLESRPAVVAGMDASRSAERSEEMPASRIDALRTPFTLLSLVSGGAKGEANSKQCTVDFPA